MGEYIYIYARAVILVLFLRVFFGCFCRDQIFQSLGGSVMLYLGKETQGGGG